MANRRSLDYIAIDELKAADVNPKGHAGEVIQDSMDRFGYTAPIEIDERTGQLVSGHGRVDALKALREAGKTPPDGITKDWKVPVVRGWASKDDDDAKAYLVSANRTVELGGWDDGLADFLQGLDDLSGVGFTLDEINELAAKIIELPPAKTDPDHVPEPPKDPISKLGDLWVLGDHRVICGDSTDVLVLDRLLDHRPDMIFTDPPYGMNVDVRYDAMHSSKDHRKTGDRFKPVAGDNEDFDALPFLGLFADVAEQFWWGADYYRKTIDDGGSWVVWDKRDNDAGMNLDAVIGASFELCWSKQQHKREIARVLWSGHHGMQQEDTKSRVHPTQKPVGLVQWFFERWGKRDDVVLDLFGGSGSTLIACHGNKRRARLVELDPQYVDVICKRYEEHTGELPILESTGEAVSFTQEESRHG